MSKRDIDIFDNVPARMQRFKSSQLFNDKEHRETDRFILGLALAYNDIKDISGLIIMSAGKIEGFQKSYGSECVMSANATGVASHLFRVLVGTLNELLNLIADCRRRGVTEDKLLKNASSKLKPDAKKIWRDLLDFEKSGGGEANSKSKLMNLLAAVRGNVAFHYYQTKSLQQGYEYFIKKGEKRGTGEWCYLSMGGALNNSRYYFADGAADGYINIEQERAGLDVLKEATTQIGHVRTCIGGLINEYLKQRKIVKEHVPNCDQHEHY